MRARLGGARFRAEGADVSSRCGRAGPFEIWDRDLLGFILRVQPSGAKAYIVQVGRGRRVTIGTVGALTPAQARDRAEKVLGNVAHNRAPLAGLDASGGL
jgi:hypothetical protein